MADLSVTPSGVKSSIPLNAQRGIAAVTILAGQPLYKDTANANKLNLADSNAVGPANVFAGIALHGSSPGQPIRFIAIDPSLITGFIAVAGDTIYLSDNPGQMTKLYSDIASGSTVITLGNMINSTTMNLLPNVGGVK